MGIQRRGVPLAQRLADRIREYENMDVPVGILDITLYRDDLSTLAEQPVLNSTDIPFDINGKVVVMVDDVLYTGRTARAAMDALIDMGRPTAIQFAVLIDRGIGNCLYEQTMLVKCSYIKNEVVNVQVIEFDDYNRVVITEYTKNNPFNIVQ